MINPLSLHHLHCIFSNSLQRNLQSRAHIQTMFLLLLLHMLF
jgi:hypothetical protein